LSRNQSAVKVGARGKAARRAAGRAAQRDGEARAGGPGKERGKAGARRHRYTAADADKYELYQLAVQSADVDAAFLRDTYRRLNRRAPRHLREDFCGTSLLCCEWVKLGGGYTAEGYDLDSEPLEWGRVHNHAPLGAAARRIRLHLADARDPSPRKVDVRVAQNFSYWVFHARAEMLDYFERARASLAPGGIFVLDLYGGTESTEEMFEERRIEGGFTYVWDQAAYRPGSGEFLCNIHFKFRDGSELKNAFQYRWRFWNLPELRDVLADAGFSRVDSYFEGEDPDDPEEGNGEFERDNEGENCEAWIGYLVAQR